MIFGIGTDVVEIEKIKRAIEKNPKFLEKVYTHLELEYSTRNGKLMYNSLAGMWAAKEAFAKATGMGFREFFLKDVEIIHNWLGAPCIKLYNKAKEFDNKKIHLSISHSDFVAVAYCIIEE